jgi:hypothetical protein
MALLFDWCDWSGWLLIAGWKLLARLVFVIVSSLDMKLKMSGGTSVHADDPPVSNDFACRGHF